MKKVDIGLRKARILCQMSHAKRLEFLADGLPIILASAQSFRQASHGLKNNPREVNVLAGFAEEEAAKILILVDAARCPRKILSSKLGTIVGWFYDHLARLIYSEAAIWKPTDVAQLRGYVDVHRKAHYVDGYAGEYIMPNWTLYERESRLYADIEAYESGSVGWNSPTHSAHAISTSFGSALVLAEAMEALGIFTPKGMKAISEIWGNVAFTNAEGPSDAKRLTEELLNRLVKEQLPLGSATQDHVNVLYDRWQLPMYDFDFRPIHVSLDELRAEQDQMYWSEVGSPF